MKLVTAAEMAELDRMAIQNMAIPGIVLMENAGLQTVLAMERHFGALEGRRVCIVCGKGNNGGDGLVTARHLFNRRARVQVFLLGEVEDVTGDARTNLDIVFNLGVPVETLALARDAGKVKECAAQSHILVDAMLGTGLQEAPRGIYAQVISLLNGSGKPIVAVDTPSGFCATTGKVLGPECVRAVLTVSFGLPKIGLVCSPQRGLAGKVEVVDIGIPSALVGSLPLQVNLLEGGHLKHLFKPRAVGTHKGTYGHVLVVAGSPGKTGAGVMTAEAALRGGAGLVTLGVPRSLNRRVESKTKEVMTVGFPETKSRTISPDAVNMILTLAERRGTVAIGPGMYTHPKTAALVEDLLTNLSCPTVLDADGINNVPLSSIKYSKAPLIITPHPGEMGRLLGITSQEVQENRLQAVQDTAVSCQTYVVLKGDRTLIGDPEGNVYVTPNGNPGMATAGAGDVLTGIIAAFLGQGMAALDACRAGVYVHGAAGDLAKEQKGEWGLIASDIMGNIPQAILNLAGEDLV